MNSLPQSVIEGIRGRIKMTWLVARVSGVNICEENELHCQEGRTRQSLGNRVGEQLVLAMEKALVQDV